MPIFSKPIHKKIYSRKQQLLGKVIKGGLLDINLSGSAIAALLGGLALGGVALGGLGYLGYKQLKKGLTFVAKEVAEASKWVSAKISQLLSLFLSWITKMQKALYELTDHYLHKLKEKAKNLKDGISEGIKNLGDKIGITAEQLATCAQSLSEAAQSGAASAKQKVEDQLTTLGRYASVVVNGSNTLLSKVSSYVSPSDINSLREATNAGQNLQQDTNSIVRQLSEDQIELGRKRKINREVYEKQPTDYGGVKELYPEPDAPKETKPYSPLDFMKGPGSSGTAAEIIGNRTPKIYGGPLDNQRGAGFKHSYIPAPRSKPLRIGTGVTIDLDKFRQIGPRRLIRV